MARKPNPRNLDAEYAEIREAERRLAERKKAIKAKLDAARDARLLDIGRLAESAGIAALDHAALSEEFAAISKRRSPPAAAQSQPQTRAAA